MIKRLNLFASAADTDLTSAIVDKSHDKLKFPMLRKIFKNINSEKYTTSLLSALKKNFKSSCYTLRIKSLIVLHYLIKKTSFQNERLLLFAQDQLNEMKDPKLDHREQPKSKKKISIQNQQKEYIQKNIIQFYIIYLLKYMMHSKAYLSAKDAIQGKVDNFGIIEDPSPKRPQDTTCATKLQQSLTQFSVNSTMLMFHIHNGFQILNLINFIIQSQQSFNKMGRYYLEHEEVLNLFIMYLDDMTIYNDYTKKLAKLLTKTVNYIKEEEIKHCFLYLTESQKTSDRLYEFYYNRYYYSKVKKLITLPTFLTIQNDDFQRVVKQIKKVDKQLFLVVKDSKYSHQYKLNRTCTEANQPTSRSHAKDARLNRTMMTEIGSKKISTLNRTIQDLKQNGKTLKDIEKNFNNYIQTFDDIFDDDDGDAGERTKDV